MRDEGLTARAMLGDDDAFAVIVARHRPAIVRYCSSILLNTADAEDAAQTTMVNARAALRTRRRSTALRPWLFRIAHNEAVSLLRRRRPNETLLELDRLVPERGDGEGPLASRASLRSLIADLVELPERQRAALLMRELVGLSYPEISQALGTTPAAVTQCVFEARRNLRQLESGRGLDCVAVQRSISDGDRRGLRGRTLRAHLHGCGECTSFATAIGERRRELCLLFPLAGKGALLAAGGLLGTGGARVAISCAEGASAAPGVPAAALAAVLAGMGGITVGQLVAPASRSHPRAVAVNPAYGASHLLRFGGHPGGGRLRAGGARSIARPQPGPGLATGQGRGRAGGSQPRVLADPLAASSPRPSESSPPSGAPSQPISPGAVSPPLASSSQPTTPGAISQHYGQAGQQIGPAGISQHYGQAAQQIGPAGIIQQYGPASQQIGPAGISQQYGPASAQITAGCVRGRYGSIVVQFGPACPPASAPAGG